MRNLTDSVNLASKCFNTELLDRLISDFGNTDGTVAGICLWCSADGTEVTLQHDSDCAWIDARDSRVSCSEQEQRKEV